MEKTLLITAVLVIVLALGTALFMASGGFENISGSYSRRTVYTTFPEITNEPVIKALSYLNAYQYRIGKDYTVYRIRINKILLDEKRIVFEFYPSDTTSSFNEKEERSIDVNNDKIPDISIKVLRIYSDSVKFSIRLTTDIEKEKAIEKEQNPPTEVKEPAQKEEGVENVYALPSPPPKPEWNPILTESPEYIKDEQRGYATAYIISAIILVSILTFMLWYYFKREK